MRPVLPPEKPVKFPKAKRGHKQDQAQQKPAAKPERNNENRQKNDARYGAPDINRVINSHIMPPE